MKKYLSKLCFISGILLICTSTAFGQYAPSQVKQRGSVLCSAGCILYPNGSTAPKVDSEQSIAVIRTVGWGSLKTGDTVRVCDGTTCTAFVAQVSPIASSLTWIPTGAFFPDPGTSYKNSNNFSGATAALIDSGFGESIQIEGYWRPYRSCAIECDPNAPPDGYTFVVTGIRVTGGLNTKTRVHQ
jgi:hypothetical protein